MIDSSVVYAFKIGLYGCHVFSLCRLLVLYQTTSVYLSVVFKILPSLGRVAWQSLYYELIGALVESQLRPPVMYRQINTLWVYRQQIAFLVGNSRIAQYKMEAKRMGVSGKRRK